MMSMEVWKKCSIQTMKEREYEWARRREKEKKEREKERERESMKSDPLVAENFPLWQSESQSLENCWKTF